MKNDEESDREVEHEEHESEQDRTTSIRATEQYPLADDDEHHSFVEILDRILGPRRIFSWAQLAQDEE